MTLSGNYGTQPYGHGFWSGNSGAVVGIVAEPIRENTVRITFYDDVFVTGLDDTEDGLSASKYSISAVSGEGLDGNVIRDVRAIRVLPVVDDPSQLDIITDRPLSHYPCAYQITAFGVYRSAGVSFPSPMVASFTGVQNEFVKPVESFYKSTKDMSNPNMLSSLLDPVPDTSDSNLGTFPVGDDGDYAQDEGIENLKKRVLRRCVTRPGGFVWLPDYGVGIGAYGKKSNSHSIREKIRSEIEAQVGNEPDVLAVKVLLRYSPESNGIVWFYIKVKTSTGRAFQFDVPLVQAA